MFNNYIGKNLLVDGRVYEGLVEVVLMIAGDRGGSQWVVEDGVFVIENDQGVVRGDRGRSGAVDGWSGWSSWSMGGRFHHYGFCELVVVRTWATEQSRKQTDGDPRLNLV